MERHFSVEAIEDDVRLAAVFAPLGIVLSTLLGIDAAWYRRCFPCDVDFCNVFSSVCSSYEHTRGTRVNC